MFILLFQNFEVSGFVALLTGVGGAIVSFIVCYVYMRSGIESKKASGWESLYKLEEERAAKYEKLYNAEKGEHNLTKIDYESLSVEYSQLSELFSKKSMILEAFTGQYGSAAKAIEVLAAQGKLTLPRRLIEQNIHSSTSGGD